MLLWLERVSCFSVFLKKLNLRLDVLYPYKFLPVNSWVWHRNSLRACNLKPPKIFMGFFQSIQSIFVKMVVYLVSLHSIFVKMVAYYYKKGYLPELERNEDMKLVIFPFFFFLSKMSLCSSRTIWNSVSLIFPSFFTRLFQISFTSCWITFCALSGKHFVLQL